MDKTLWILEIGLEEVPHSEVTSLKEKLQEVFENLFTSEELAHEIPIIEATPRRVVLFWNVASYSPGKVVNRKGPLLEKAVNGDHWTSAGLGFLKSAGLDETLLPHQVPSYKEGDDQALSFLEEGGKKFLFSRQHKEGKSGKNIIESGFIHCLRRIEFKISMRWGSEKQSFIRPIHYLVGFWGEELLSLGFADVQSAEFSRAHRQMFSNQAIPMSASDYRDRLRSYDVILSEEERRSMILAGFRSIEAEHPVKVLENEALLQKVVYLVEYPKTQFCSFDPSFLSLPKELVMSEMVEHQFYFPCEEKKLGNKVLENEKSPLTPCFVVVANVRDSAYTRNGYERVLRARLSDGLFLYREDLKKGLRQMGKEVRNVVYVGESTYGDKIDLARKIAQFLYNTVKDASQKESFKVLLQGELLDLYKGDLVSKVVFEFPELQGVMGTYYAKALGIDESDAQAIVQSYYPQSIPKIPHEGLGRALCLVEKLSSLILCFKGGLIPTGSRDPYALRRDAVVVLSVVLQWDLDFDFSTLLENLEIDKEVFQALRDFMLQRYRKILKDRGSADEFIDSVFVRFRGSGRFLSMDESLKAIKALWESQSFQQIVQSAKRIKKITGPGEHYGEVNPILLKEDPEKKLYEYLRSLREKEPLTSSAVCQNFQHFYALMEDLTPLLDAFFDKVLVNVADGRLQTNRKALLQNTLELLCSLADLSMLPGQE